MIQTLTCWFPKVSKDPDMSDTPPRYGFPFIQRSWINSIVNDEGGWVLAQSLHWEWVESSKNEVVLEYLVICALSVNPRGGSREMKIHGEIVPLSILQVEARPFSTRWNNMLIHLAFFLFFAVSQMEPRQLPAWRLRELRSWERDGRTGQHLCPFQWEQAPQWRNNLLPLSRMWRAHGCISKLWVFSELIIFRGCCDHDRRKCMHLGSIFLGFQHQKKHPLFPTGVIRSILSLLKFITKCCPPPSAQHDPPSCYSFWPTWAIVPSTSGTGNLQKFFLWLSLPSLIWFCQLNQQFFPCLNHTFASICFIPNSRQRFKSQQLSDSELSL